MTLSQIRYTIILINRQLVELSMRLYLAQLSDDTYMAQAIRTEAMTLKTEVERLKGMYAALAEADRKAAVRWVEDFLGCEVSQ